MERVSTLGMSREDWLIARKGGIGGSDAAAVMGLNPYKSPVELFFEKVSDEPPEEEQSEAAYWGTVLEEPIARRYAELHPEVRVRRNNHILIHPEHKFLFANLDREVHTDGGETYGLEIKTVGLNNAKKWEDSDVPIWYALQCQHYMAVMGFDRMYLAVLVLNRGFYHFVIERSPEEIAALTDAEETFWRDHVLPQVPPPIDGSESTLDTLSKLYPAAQPEGICPLSRQAADDLAAIEELTVQRKDLDAAIRAAKARVMEEMGDLPAGACEGWTVSWKTQTLSTIDTARLRRDHPDIYAQYTKTTTGRVFRLNHSKEAETL